MRVIQRMALGNAILATSAEQLRLSVRAHQLQYSASVASVGRVRGAGSGQATATATATATAPHQSQSFQIKQRQERRQIASMTAVPSYVAPALAPALAPTTASAKCRDKNQGWIAGAMAVGAAAERIDLLHAFSTAVPRPNGAGRRTVAAWRPLARHAVAWPTRG